MVELVSESLGSTVVLSVLEGSVAVGSVVAVGSGVVADVGTVGLVVFVGSVLVVGSVGPVTVVGSDVIVMLVGFTVVVGGSVVGATVVFVRSPLVLEVPVSLVLESVSEPTIGPQQARVSAQLIHA